MSRLLRILVLLLLLLPAACVTTPSIPVDTTTTTAAAQKKPEPAKKKKQAREMSAEAARAVLQAELLMQEGDLPAAVAELKAAVTHDEKSPYLRLRLGEALLLVGDVDGADAAADEVVRLAPSDQAQHRIAGLRLKAAAREQLGDDDGAIKALRAAIDVAPDRLSSAMLAERLVKKGQLDAAYDVVEQWMAAEPGAVDGWVALSRVFAEKSDIERALRLLDKAQAIDPGDVDAWGARRDLYLALGRFDEAADASRSLARARGDSPEIRLLLLASLALKDASEARALAAAWIDDDGGDDTRLLVADSFERAGLLDDALKALTPPTPARARLALEQARLLLAQHRSVDAADRACPIASRPGGEERLMDYAVSLCARAEADAGDVEGAVARLLDAARARPHASRLLDALGAMLPKTTESRRAAVRQHLEKIDVEAEDAGVVEAVAFCFDSVGERGKGRLVLQRALQKRPADRDLVFAHARLLEKQAASVDETRGAVELVERLIERSGADVSTLNFLSFTLAEKGLRADEARAWAWRAVLLDPLNGYVVDTLGWATLMAGDVDGAIALLRRADRLSPDEGEIWFHLAAALQKKRDVEGARAAAAKARALLKADDALLPRLDTLEKELRS